MAEMIRTAPRDIHALRVWALVECLERQRELPGRVRPVRPELAVDATLLREVLERRPEHVSYEEWLHIDEAEKGRGEPHGRPRVKLTRVHEMLEAIEAKRKQ